MAERVSLSKADIQAGIGAELLTLCQSITEDGTLGLNEIKELTRWLNEHRKSDLPSITFLKVTLKRIISDGKVTRDEVRELYHAIETILPVEARKHAVAARKSVEMQAKVQEKIKKEEEFNRRQDEKEKERRIAKEEADKNRQIAWVNCMVAGVHYDGRASIIERYAKEGDTVYLMRDRANSHSKNAIKIALGNKQSIGFVPEDDARAIAPILDQGCQYRAVITKILVGGRVPIPVVQANFYSTNATHIGLTRSE